MTTNDAVKRLIEQAKTPAPPPCTCDQETCLRCQLQKSIARAKELTK